MQPKSLAIVGVVAIVLMLGISVLFTTDTAHAPIVDNDSSDVIDTGSSDTPDIFLGNIGEHIVYAESVFESEETFKAFCTERGGAIDECGSPCPPDAEVCIQVCALTCDL